MGLFFLNCLTTNTSIKLSNKKLIFNNKNDKYDKKVKKWYYFLVL